LIINNLKYDIKSVVGGLFLGIPNYFSIYFLLKTLEKLNKDFHLTSATIFTLNNILIIMFSIIIGLIIFKEKISLQKIIGFIIALLSIILITL
jgi:drug/metabolite transporter (DMT)-like permease